jgi:hypothetical protein
VCLSNSEEAVVAGETEYRKIQNEVGATAGAEINLGLATGRMNAFEDCE